VELIEERVAMLEGRVIEQSEMFSEIRVALGRLEARVDRRFDRLESRVATDFRWTVGIQITTLITVVVALIGIAAMR